MTFGGAEYISLQNSNSDEAPNVSPSWWAQTHVYAYDANGNRLVAPGLTASPVYDSQDRLLSYGNCTYTYKRDGSLQTKTCPEGTTTYDYDAFGNLRHVGLPDGTAIDYIIDGQNRRVGEKINGVMVAGFVYRSQLQPVAWLNGDGSIRATFVYGLKPNVPEYMIQAGARYRIVTDQVGSVRLVLDPNGTVVERIDYDEFGTLIADSGPGVQPFTFAGGLRDDNLELVRFGARDYDPAAARWTSKDFLQFGGGLSSFYSYVGADPLNRFDPLGLSAYCTYTIADGHLICDNGNGSILADTFGYAGAPGHVNNPADVGLKDMGPLPPGLYEVDDHSYDNKGSTGPLTVNLLQIEGWTFGRGKFRFHGDNRKKPPRSSSEGCIIVNPRSRMAIGDAGGGLLRVTEFDWVMLVQKGDL